MTWLLHLPVTEFRAFNARGAACALDCGDALETGESLRGESLHRLPAALKPIDIRDELQDFGGNSDVLNLMHDRISILTHFHPILAGGQANIHPQLAEDRIVRNDVWNVHCREYIAIKGTSTPESVGSTVSGRFNVNRQRRTPFSRPRVLGLVLAYGAHGQQLGT